MPRVRVSPLGPNKVDSFDTSGIETINLFLFAKRPVDAVLSEPHLGHSIANLPIIDNSSFLFFSWGTTRHDKMLYSNYTPIGKPCQQILAIFFILLHIYENFVILYKNEIFYCNI